MTDAELEQKLRAVRPPALGPDYLEDFPRAVFARLRSLPAATRPPARCWAPRWGWAAGLAFVFLIVGFAIGRWGGRTGKAAAAPADILADAKVIRETLALFPHRVRAIVQDQQGLKLVLADQPDVPVSTPIYVRVCAGGNCASAVAFSGQEIQIAGQKLTVLSEADGGIILEGEEFVWSSGKRSYGKSNLKIEARNLGPLAMLQPGRQGVEALGRRSD
jgi:hypothetical protein